ncbi:uncharacterized protein RSE6_04971 [Rhynchosporium secalis]|uniref:3'-5' exonuclease domain-containing protein n=1 Tax=Rhynchosporium secalis TaxID=38038 RepID=A0A1E1M6M8_RHYSE|nr:uncharacterized protein RSE6_04971 [Rhynchosporium secalis]
MKLDHFVNYYPVFEGYLPLNSQITNIRDHCNQPFWEQHRRLTQEANDSAATFIVNKQFSTMPSSISTPLEEIEGSKPKDEQFSSAPCSKFVNIHASSMADVPDMHKPIALEFCTKADPFYDDIDMESLHSEQATWETCELCAGREICVDSEVCIDSGHLATPIESGGMPNPQETLATFTRNFDHFDLHTPGKFNSSSRTLIETPEQLKTFLPLLSKLKRSTLRAPELSLDYEACKLAEDGDIRVMQMRVRSMNQTFVFDIKKLGGITMFEAKNTKGLSLREVLESNKHIKLIWDCRQDQDALAWIWGSGLRRKSTALEHGSSSPWKGWMTPTELSELVRMNAEAEEYFKKSNYGIFGYEDLPD